MAKSIIWSQESLDDIASIAEFISRDSVHHAQRVVDEIFTIAETLLDQPKMGRIVPELAEGQVREHFIYSYRKSMKSVKTKFIFWPLSTAGGY